MSENIINLNPDNFQASVIENAKPVLVDFWAPWCGPCKSIAPILDEISTEMDSIQICKLNVDDNQELAGKYNIRYIPTMLLFKNGEVIDNISGLMSKEDLKAQIEASL